MTLSSLKEYGLLYQTKVIRSLLKNRNFLLNIRDVLEVDMFSHPGHHWIVGKIIEYFDNFNINPTQEFLNIELKKVENKVLKTSITEQLNVIFSKTNDDTEYVETEFNNFCINQKLKSALLDSVDLLNRGDFEKIRVIIENALKSGQNKDLGLEYVRDIEKRYREDSREPIPTPWSEINNLLGGGLGKGDLGLIYGNPGGGKSWCLVAIGVLALMLGYKVIHYTLELGEDYVGRRYDACLTGINVSEIHQYKEQISEKLKDFNNNLIIKEYPAKGATLGTIKSHFNKCRDQGFEAQLILLDYIDILKPSSRRGTNKEEIDDLYYGTKGIAKELQVPIWSVSQVNRSGYQDEVIEGDKSAGSYDKLMVVDFSMSQSRNKKDKVNNTARWHIMKNRYGSDGMTWNVSTDLGCGKFQIISEYDDMEEYRKPTTNTNKDVLSLEEKKMMRSKLMEFKIE